MPVSRINRSNELELLAAGKLRPVLVGGPEDEDLEGVCALLNGEGPRELCSELRELVELWQKSGPNLAKMLKDNKVLAACVKHGRTLLVPTNTGKGHLCWLPTPGQFKVGPSKDQALAHFMDLIVNPHWNKLGGPCQRCGKYYRKKTSRQKTYCSRRCGSMSTAITTTRKRREEERALKLRRAEEAVNRWATIRTRRPWKEWVSANNTTITVKWLTRAVNRGDLTAPI